MRLFTKGAVKRKLIEADIIWSRSNRPRTNHQDDELSVLGTGTVELPVRS